MFPRIAMLLIALCLAAQPSLALAQSRPYDGIQAGLDAFRLAEEQRQTTASYQLSLNDHLRFWSGLPTSRGETIYYGYTSPAYSAYVPGSILVFPSYPIYYPLARQPIGQRQEQTGPNRWESHPVYDPPLTPYRPLPPVDSPLLNGTPYATIDPAAQQPPVEPPPVPAPAEPTPPPFRRGPREYYAPSGANLGGVFTITCIERGPCRQGQIC